MTEFFEPRGDRWRGLAAAMHILLLAGDEPSLCRVIAEGAASMVGCDSVTVFLATANGVSRAARYPDGEADELVAFVEERLADRVVEQRRSVSSADKHADPELDLAARRLIGERRICHVRPLRRGDEVLGAISVVASAPALLQDELDVLRRFADSAGFALASLRDRLALEQLAFTDPLTGLANRRGLERALEARAGSEYFFVLVDFDGLKAINDQLTYEDGDAVIRAAGAELARQVSGDEVAGRLAGDEFVLLLDSAPSADTATRIDAIRSSVEKLQVPEDVAPLFRGASIGYVNANQATGSRELLRAATAELHADKARRKKVG